MVVGGARDLLQFLLRALSHELIVQFLVLERFAASVLSVCRAKVVPSHRLPDCCSITFNHRLVAKLRFELVSLLMHQVVLQMIQVLV